MSDEQVTCPQCGHDRVRQVEGAAETKVCTSCAAKRRVARQKYRLRLLETAAGKDGLAQIERHVERMYG